MKVFRKMFAFAITVSAIAIATSAFAATAVYDDTDTANPLVKVTDATFTEADQMTVAVVPVNFGENSDAEDIYYINQDEAATIVSDLESGLKIKDNLTVASNYEVRVAGTNTDMQKISFATVEEPDEYEVFGTNLTAATAVGFKGQFSVNAGVSTLYVTVKDANNNDATAVIDWDLSDLDIVTNANITFGLEIQSETPMDMSGISIVGVSDVAPEV